MGSRAPHGARGLKQLEHDVQWLMAQSRPAWGAWIETKPDETTVDYAESRPAWGAWIETRKVTAAYRGHPVAPRMGRVD